MLGVCIAILIAKVHTQRIEIQGQTMVHQYLSLSDLFGSYDVKLISQADMAFLRFSVFKDARNLANVNLTVQISRENSQTAPHMALFFGYFVGYDNLVSGCNISFSATTSGGEALEFGICDAWARASVAMRDCQLKLQLFAANTSFLVGAFAPRSHMLLIERTDISVAAQGSSGVVGGIVALARETSIQLIESNISVGVGFLQTQESSLMHLSPIWHKQLAGCIAGASIDSRLYLTKGGCAHQAAGNYTTFSFAVALAARTSCETHRFNVAVESQNGQQFIPVGRIAWDAVQCEESKNRLYCW